ncbi:MAG: PEP-CTERM sorting domain-containing protein [Immundisolibacter sp.]|uniref:PEP-CTERM sorting domain-containing protein n=1 Tax=Immundisolibacter sp. TaxID=1934948 RepID=UPI003EE0927D
MRYKPTARALAVAIALSALAASPANALFTTTSVVGFENTATVVDPETAGTTYNNNASLGTSSIGQFNPATGVLMGATLNLDSTRTQTTEVNVTDGPNTGTNHSTTVTGTGSSTATISAPGVSSTYASITQAASCTAGRLEACDGAPVTSAPADTDLTGSVAAGSLGSYVGLGTVAVTRKATVLSATQGPPLFTGVATTTSTVTWKGDLSATYEYLLHAAPSFDGSSELLALNLDFGTLYLDEDATAQNFSIFNLAGARVGLDLDSFSGTGDTAAFTTDLVTFFGLAAGGSNGYYFDFVTSAIGEFSATYNFLFSDADVGAASSRYSYNGLVINLAGRVIERTIESIKIIEANGLPGDPRSVPVPSVLALLGSGLFALGLGRRRRR